MITVCNEESFAKYIIGQWIFFNSNNVSFSLEPQMPSPVPAQSGGSIYFFK